MKEQMLFDIDTVIETVEKSSVNYETLKEIFGNMAELPLVEKVEALNSIREMLHDISPFKSEPVDLIKWVLVDEVVKNEYNPNSVAPPEMELLRHSINQDGYTQPVVTWLSDTRGREVIDGFHRSRVCRECDDVNKRVQGYLPVVTMRDDNTGENDRMASTIRHNRARGKHSVTAMSDIIIELKNRNWKNSRISRELGMDEDEVLRLCQITGLQSLFDDREFSKSWEAADSIEAEYEMLTDSFDDDEDRGKTTNTSDPNRIFHTYDKWECVKFNLYGTKVEGMKKDECEQEFAKFLSDLNRFEESLKSIISEWKHSCEHYLTNTAMNRIAWLGQAGAAHSMKIPSKFCGGFNLMDNDKQESANEMALKYLNIWLKDNGLDEATMDQALSLGRQVSIY